ncbi:MAG: ABC transporter ATP-binding protein [Halieaceae bacterium]
MASDDARINLPELRKQLWALLAPESSFLWVIIIYGGAISVMTLAVPIAVQTLINSIANIGSLRAVYSLALALLLILLSYGALSALRIWMVELYRRRVFARLSAEISYSVVRAPHWVFEGRRNMGMTHRYFDIMIFQKNVPRLFADGFALILQTAVGFALVSFYHPWLFLFNALTLFVVFLIWKIWSSGARKAAVELSKSKYAMARWLSDMEVAHDFFKSKRHLSLAADKTNGLATTYLDKHKKLFSHTFSQTISFLVLYAVGSAALLALGGWLVTLGELSIGQLVAAELVMAAIFLGLSRFSSYLKYYYELYGAADKLTEVLSLPEENPKGTERAAGSASLTFINTTISRAKRYCHLDWSIPSAAKVCVQTDEAWIQPAILSVLRAHRPVNRGRITLGGINLEDLDLLELRQSIQGVDRSLILECSIREFLLLHHDQSNTETIINALEQVYLWPLIESLPDGLDTRLSATGAPLQGAEMLLLKLAGAILAQPSVLVLNQLFDQLLPIVRDNVLEMLSKQSFTVLYFTSQPAHPAFTQHKLLTATAESGNE